MAKFQETVVKMGHEGRLYLGPAGIVPLPGKTGVVELIHVKDVKYTYSFGQVDATMRKHRGTKASTKGALEISISFLVENVLIPGVGNAAGTRPEDVKKILDALFARHKPVSLLMLDQPLALGGTGPCGDFELFPSDKSETDDAVQEWSVAAHVSAEGGGAGWYPDDFGEDEESGG